MNIAAEQWATAFIMCQWPHLAAKQLLNFFEIWKTLILIWEFVICWNNPKHGPFQGLWYWWVWGKSFPATTKEKKTGLTELRRHGLSKKHQDRLKASSEARPISDLVGNSTDHKKEVKIAINNSHLWLSSSCIPIMGIFWGYSGEFRQRV